mgnify:CR=1 FL=1
MPFWCKRMEYTHVTHTFGPVYDDASRILILGSFPSVKSRENQFYYGHPQNRFWKVMGALFDEPEPLGIEGRTAFLYAHGIALWDVLSSCAIVGASDASIVDPVANDLSRIAEAAPLEAVFTTGSKATALYRRFGAPQLPGLAHTGLPSTSPANARMRLDDLVKAYLPIRETLERRDGGGR